MWPPEQRHIRRSTKACGLYLCKGVKRGRKEQGNPKGNDDVEEAVEGGGEVDDQDEGGIGKGEGKARE